MKTFLSACVIIMAVSTPASPQQSRENPLSHSVPNINLSLDLGSRDLMASALGDVETSVSAVIYKFDDPLLMPTLLKALNRGIKFQIICDEKESRKKASLIGELAQAGAEIRLWPRSQGKLHAKFVLCDHNRVLTGSWNWTKSAGGNNLEILMDIKDDETVATFNGVFARLWKMSHPRM